MGFMKSDSGFKAGNPLTIKGNMKEGFFQLLGGKNIGRSVTFSLLKEVDLANTVLFPKKDSKERHAHTWKQLFFRNMETNEISALLIKTYSHGRFEHFRREVAIYSSKNGGGFDVSDFVIEAVIEDMKNGESKFQIGFYFCKDKNKKPVSYLNEDGTVNEAAIPQKLSKEDFATNKEIYDTQYNDLYDERIGQEIIVNNYSAAQIEQYNALPPAQKMRLCRYVLMQYGYFDEPYFKEISAAASFASLPSAE